MKHKATSIFGVLFIGFIVGVRLLVIFIEWNEPEDSFDPNNIDIGPAIQAHFEETQRKRTNELMAGIERQMAAGRKQTQTLRTRWAEAHTAGLVGETGVLYVPSKYKLAWDGHPNEFGKGQTTPPKTGWYVTLERSKNTSGSIKAKITSGGSGEENPAAKKSAKPAKSGTRMVR